MPQSRPTALEHTLLHLTVDSNTMAESKPQPQFYAPDDPWEYDRPPARSQLQSSMHANQIPNGYAPLDLQLSHGRN